MFMKKPVHKKFDYMPRFYKPEEDPNERKKRRLGFASERKYIKKKRSPLLWFLIFIAVLYIYLKFGGYI